MDEIKISDLKEGDIIFQIGLTKFFGRVWELRYSRVKIVKINRCSVRIDRIDDNGGKGNAWTIKNDKLKDMLGNCTKTKEEAIRILTPALKKYSEDAVEILKGYTESHKNYEWYVYTKNILKDIYEVAKNGLDNNEYKEMKKKYSKYENKIISKGFGL